MKKTTLQPITGLFRLLISFRLWLAFFLAVPLLGRQLTAQSAQSSFKVEYLSRENVYLSGGRAGGLSAGDRLVIKKGTTILAELEVVFVAEHSASCRIVRTSGKSGKIKVGSTAEVVRRIEASASDTVEIAKDSSKKISRPATVAYQPLPPRLANFGGRVSMQMNHWEDRRNGGLNFNQSTLRFDFRARRLWDKELSFTFRGRERRDRRGPAYTGQGSSTVSTTYIQELSLANDNEAAPFNVYFGRISPPQIGGVGYFDGLLVQRNFSGRFRTGLFGGLKPWWQFSDSNLSLQKYGVYLNFTGGEYTATYLDFTIAALGDYHLLEISRELFYTQGFFNWANRFSLSHVAELDFNRSWRKQKAGTAITVSNVFLNARYRFNDRFTASLYYDTRKNYWTYETWSLADSLFDSRLRQGVRLQGELRLPANWRTHAGAGYHKQSGGPGATYSYSIGGNKSGWLTRRTALSLQATGFFGAFQDGFNFSAHLQQSFWQADLVGLGYGSMLYTSSVTTRRSNRWVELYFRKDLFSRFFLNGEYQYNYGDDIRGHQIQADVSLLY